MLRFESVETDLKLTRRRLNYFHSQLLTTATPSILNSLAFEARQREPQNMDRQLDRPTTFTKRGIAYTKATATKLYSDVFVKEIQARYLKWSVFGGTRTRADHGPIPVAPVKQRLNKYGNITRGNWKNLFNGGKANNIVVLDRGRHTGVYRRTSKKLVLLVSLVDRASYQKRWTFHANIASTVRAKFKTVAAHQLQRAENKAKGIN